MLSDGVTGYIGIGEEDVAEMGLNMARALANLTAHGAEAIVLDIRGNDGGCVLPPHSLTSKGGDREGAGGGTGGGGVSAGAGAGASSSS